MEIKLLLIYLTKDINLNTNKQTKKYTKFSRVTTTDMELSLL